jgi:hypothetical protein
MNRNLPCGMATCDSNVSDSGRRGLTKLKRMHALLFNPQARAGALRASDVRVTKIAIFRAKDSQ